MKSYFGTRIDGGGRARASGPCAKGDGEGIRGMGAVQGFATSENGHSVPRNGGRAMGADLERSGWRGTVGARLVAKGYQEPGPRNGDVDVAGCVSRRLPH